MLRSFFCHIALIGGLFSWAAWSAPTLGAGDAPQFEIIVGAYLSEDMAGQVMLELATELEEPFPYFVRPIELRPEWPAYQVGFGPLPDEASAQRLARRVQGMTGYATQVQRVPTLRKE